MGSFAPFKPISTFFYYLVIGMKLIWYSRKKRRKKKVVKTFLYENLEKEKLDKKTIDMITENYLKIGEIFLDRKVLRTAFSLNRRFKPKKVKSEK